MKESNADTKGHEAKSDSNKTCTQNEIKKQHVKCRNGSNTRSIKKSKCERKGNHLFKTSNAKKTKVNGQYKVAKESRNALDKEFVKEDKTRNSTKQFVKISKSKKIRDNQMKRGNKKR
jgi:hypothetical protein